MGSDFLFEVLMEGTELHVVVVGVDSAGFVAPTKLVAVLRKLKVSGGFALLALHDYTLLCARECGSSPLRLEA